MFRVFRDCFHERTHTGILDEGGKLSLILGGIGEVVIIDGGHGRAVVSAGIPLFSFFKEDGAAGRKKEKKKRKDRRSRPLSSFVSLYNF